MSPQFCGIRGRSWSCAREQDDIGASAGNKGGEAVISRVIFHPLRSRCIDREIKNNKGALINLVLPILTAI